MAHDKQKITKTAKIREFLANGYNSNEIAAWLGVSVGFVCSVRWQGLHRGPNGESYNALKMAEYRARDVNGRYSRQIKRDTKRRKISQEART